MNSIVKIREIPSENNNVEVMVIVEDKKVDYKCKMCPAFFHTKLHLVSHIDSCHSPKGFEISCPFCSEYSHQKRKKVLKHMKRRHFPNFPFKCETCAEFGIAASFDSPLYLRLHREITH